LLPYYNNKSFFLFIVFYKRGVFATDALVTICLPSLIFQS
jgi:uncharacterized membrane protein YqaE (UPF0057 family)